MKRLISLFALGIFSVSAVGCGSQESPVLVNDIASNTAINAVNTPLNSAFAQFAAKRPRNFYKGSDTSFTNKVNKNGLFDSFSKEFPYTSFFEFERDLIKTSEEYYYSYNKVKTKFIFDKNLAPYHTVQEIYKANKADMKRFIKVDILVNIINKDEIEVHNPPFQPNYKLMPTKAAQIMPTYAEIVQFNESGKVPFVRWDNSKSFPYYRDNYPRWMGMIMEFGPNKNDAYTLIQREISEAAWRP
jgi:hypothetical protein